MNGRSTRPTRGVPGRRRGSGRSRRGRRGRYAGADGAGRSSSASRGGQDPGDRRGPGQDAGAAKHGVGSGQARRFIQRRPRAGPEGRPADGPRACPAGAWRSYSLTWSGPVGRDHTMRLLLASPGLNRLLTLLRLAALAALAFVLLTGRWPSLPRKLRPAPAAALALLLFPAAAHAQDTPSPEMLQELRQRLTRPAPCEPRCVTTPSLVLRLGDGRLDLTAEVHAAADGTWAAARPSRQLDARRGEGGRRHGGRPRALRLRLPAPPARPRRASRRGRGAGTARRQLHAAVRRPAATRASRGSRLGRERPPRRRTGRGVDPADTPARRPRRASGSRGPLCPVARSHAHARLRRHLDRDDAGPPRDAARRADRRPRPAAAGRSTHARQPRRREGRSRGQPRRRRERDRLAVDARAGEGDHSPRTGRPPLVRGLAAPLQSRLVLHCREPGARLAHRRRRLRPRVPPLARRDADGRARPPARRRGPDAHDRQRGDRGHSGPQARDVCGSWRLPAAAASSRSF